MGDERAGAHTCANQVLISRLHIRTIIGADTKADWKASAITCSGDFSRGAPPGRKTNRSFSLRFAQQSLFMF
jgi:hypothetical protein